MKSATLSMIIAAVTAAALIITGCSDKKNPISAFQPEVINNADAFQFQITNARNVSTTVNYSWVNSGTRATVNHSTSRTQGSATVTLFDANNQQVYTQGLLASGTEQSSVGVAGTWRIRIVFTDFDGTANFRVEKL
ncbi:MAG: hypothetical protein AB1772_11360 [Candidatus Zixiibacteriota bacterium]